jgi:hypothetical protein
MEKWIDIEFDPRYEVSNLGDVRNKKTGRILKQVNLTNGYRQVNVSSKHRHQYVHRLVANAFIPNPDNKPEVDHIDKNRSNNNVDNLRWASHQENNEYSHGKEVGRYDNYGNLISTYPSIRKAALNVGVDASNISRAISEGRISGGYFWKMI